MAAEKKKRLRDSLSPLKIGVKQNGNTAVSVLIPGEQCKKYLLSSYEDRGWWLPYGIVNKDENVHVAASRIASEVSDFRLVIYSRLDDDIYRCTGKQVK